MWSMLRQRSLASSFGLRDQWSHRGRSDCVLRLGPDRCSHRGSARPLQHHGADGRRDSGCRGGHRPLRIQHHRGPGRRHRSSAGPLQHHGADGCRDSGCRGGHRPLRVQHHRGPRRPWVTMCPGRGSRPPSTRSTSP